MGVVFRAEDPADGAIVAIKVLRPEIADSDNSRRRFVKEARLLAALDSPFVTRLIEANTDGPYCYIAMEYVEGQSLGSLLRTSGRLDETKALEYIADAARGLAAAHAVRIVHRDIKPDNLLICTSPGPVPRLKVTDFGLARPMLQAISLDVTRPGSIVGTPLYMAPEQFGSEPVDPRADVYSLGSTLFHMLVGNPPFPLLSLPALARAVSNDPPPLVDRLNPAISSLTAGLVARCLAKSPADRPADAGAFLRAVETILGGEPSDLAAHPRTPAGSRRVVEYVHTWELAASRAQLWPFVSNTERLNRAVGLPAPKYEYRHDPDLGPRRFAKARVIGFPMEWEEHPFEWVEGRRMGILREYVRGPFKWFLSLLELLPGAGGGTTLRHTLRAEPRGIVGRIAAPFELGIKARRSLGRVYRSIDAVLAAPGALAAEDPFEPPTRLSRAGERRLLAGAAHLHAVGAAPTASEVLVRHLATAPAQDLARIRPLALARRFGIDGAAMADTCLCAVGAGLLELGWDVICPLCRIPTGRRETLRSLREHETCQACAADFPADFAQAVELVFRSHPDVRAAETQTFCAGGPAHSPHVVSQIRLAAGERMELELTLTEGSYRLRGPQLPWALPFQVEPDAAIRHWEIDLAATHRHPIPPLGTGGQVLVLRNGRNHELVLRIERSAARDDVLTAARATAMPAFRELFPGELLSPDQLAPAAVVTLLMAQIAGGDALFTRMGEGLAFRLIQASFRVIETRVRASGGSVVKTVGEGVLAAFSEVSAAVRTAFALTDAMKADPLATGLSLQVAIHRGQALVATVNDRLDYFGQTSRVTARLLESATGDDLILSASTADDHEVMALIGERRLSLVEVERDGASPILAYRIRLSPQ
jgi:class 3 adenylate cyclase